MNFVLQNQINELKGKIIVTKGMIEIYEANISYYQEQLRAHRRMNTLYFATHDIEGYERSRNKLKEEKEYLASLEALKIQLETV